MRSTRLVRLALAALLAVAASHPSTSRAQDVAGVVAKARDQIDNGNYADALRILASLKNKTLPPQLAVEAGLLETTALLVAQGADAAVPACGRAVVAAGYDPEIARDQSPKVREACRAAAKKVRSERLGSDGAKVSGLEAPPPEVAFQPVRLSTTVDKKPAWLKLVARVESSALEGAFDVPLVPSDEGPLRGTLDAAWIRPKSKLKIALVPQDRFGDLGEPLDTKTIDVPAAEALIALGSVPEGARVTLDGEPVTPEADGHVPAAPGSHEVAMTLSSGAYAEANVELRRGGITRVALAPQQPSPSFVLPAIATGTAVALLGAGGVLMLTAESRRSELEEKAAEREPGTSLPANDYAQLQAIDDERSTFQTVGIGLLAGGGAVAVLATVLWIVPATSGGSAEEAPPKPVAVVPVLGPGYVGLSGRF